MYPIKKESSPKLSHSGKDHPMHNSKSPKIENIKSAMGAKESPVIAHSHLLMSHAKAPALHHALNSKSKSMSHDRYKQNPAYPKAGKGKSLHASKKNKGANAPEWRKKGDTLSETGDDELYEQGKA